MPPAASPCEAAHRSLRRCSVIIGPSSHFGAPARARRGGYGEWERGRQVFLFTDQSIANSWSTDPGLQGCIQRGSFLVDVGCQKDRWQKVDGRKSRGGQQATPRAPHSRHTTASNVHGSNNLGSRGARLEPPAALQNLRALSQGAQAVHCSAVARGVQPHQANARAAAKRRRRRRCFSGAERGRACARRIHSVILPARRRRPAPRKQAPWPPSHNRGHAVASIPSSQCTSAENNSSRRRPHGHTASAFAAADSCARALGWRRP
ncbi:MAG: hypothetical protein J3K34DRAFT_426278 [Monoraphidium minutum]|nr:MAG: hypothetical protein J3K34DRAFT_426278 [Monoraphidium minutum]